MIKSLIKHANALVDLHLYCTQQGPEVIKVFFMLNSTELKISTAHKHYNTDK